MTDRSPYPHYPYTDEEWGVIERQADEACDRGLEREWQRIADAEMDRQYEEYLVQQVWQAMLIFTMSINKPLTAEDLPKPLSDLDEHLYRTYQHSLVEASLRCAKAFRGSHATVSQTMRLAWLMVELNKSPSHMGMQPYCHDPAIGTFWHLETEYLTSDRAAHFIGEWEYEKTYASPE